MTTTTKLTTTPRPVSNHDTHRRTLPLLVTPLSGEPFDSWLLAYAHRLGTSVGDLALALGLRQHTFLVDHTTLLHPEETARAARLTGLTTAQLDAMTLRPFAGHMIELETSRRAVTTSVWWGRRSGSRFCPQCLAERDGRWLLRWRLSWVFACTRHQTLLHDHCPRCGGIPRRKPLPIGCDTAPAICCLTVAPGTPCGSDLSDAEPRPLPADDPILAAQRWLETMVDAIETGHADQLTTAPAILFTDLRAAGGWLLRQGEPEDFDAFGVDVARAWHAAQKRYKQHDIRPSQFPPTDAALMGALVARIQSLVTGEPTMAVKEIRRLLVRSPRRPDVCPPGLHQQWLRLSPTIRGLFLRAGDPDRGYVDRLRFKTCSPTACLPVQDGTKATARATRLPHMLWPGWTVRLLPPRGFHTDPFRAVMVLSLLVPGDGRRPVTITAKHLHPYLSRVLISQVLQHLAQLGHDTVFPALCELADNLDQHGSPIDYERRRQLITPDLLSEEQWRRICRDTRIHPGLGRRLLDAQRYLVTLLTGNDLNDPQQPLKFNSANDRGVFTSFITTLSTSVRQALHQHAAEYLHNLGIDEPVAWEPPREWAPSLVPPGREPADIDLDRLRRLVFDDGVTVAEAASTLAAHVDHVRLALETLEHTVNTVRPGVQQPHEAWERRQHARTIITPEFLHQEHRQRGKRLEQIADETGISRHIISEIAAEASYAMSPGRRRIVIDEQWLREQYLVKHRSFPDIAAECGISDMTVIRCAHEYGIASRPSGVSSHPQMVTKLATTLHPDIRRAVEGGLHGWQRLHRFQAVMRFPTIDTAADHLGIDQSTLVRQLQRLEADIGTTIYHRATTTQDMRPTQRGRALLRALDHPDAQQHLAAATTRGTKTGGQVPRKDTTSEVISYHGNRRKKVPK
ncbi:MAG TPA: TniQ family protein [Amycolatopsis sp.]|nr:TniQ family protein [Amycolatopsis sp.]